MVWTGQTDVKHPDCLDWCQKARLVCQVWISQIYVNHLGWSDWSTQLIKLMCILPVVCAHLLTLLCAGATSRQQLLLCPLVRGEGRLTGASCSLLPFSSSPQLGQSSGTEKQKISFWQCVSRTTLRSMPWLLFSSSGPLLNSSYSYSLLIFLFAPVLALTCSLLHSSSQLLLHASSSLLCVTPFSLVTAYHMTPGLNSGLSGSRCSLPGSHVTQLTCSWFRVCRWPSDCVLWCRCHSIINSVISSLP